MISWRLTVVALACGVVTATACSAGGAPRADGGGAAGVGAGGNGTGGAGAAGLGGAPGSTGGMTGAGGGAPPACAGLALQQSGVLDLNLRAVSISGAVTAGGAPLSDESASRGQLVFTGAGGFSIATVDLGATGAKSYALRLPPATYDVAFRANAALCTATHVPGVPCSGGVLRRAVAITSDGVLDIDIPAVEVSGTVTLAGAPLPVGTVDRGSIRFGGAGVDPAASFALGTNAAASYRLKLMPGTYDVTFNGNAAACASATAPALPCNAGAIKTGIALGSSGVLDLDVPVVHVTGAVTLGGAPLPGESAARGALTFSGATTSGAPTGAVSTAGFGTTGAASYALALLPGTYDVALAANAALCGAGATPQVPCVGGRVVSGARLSTDGVLDVDLHAVTVTGTVTVKGAPMPTATADRGRLLFANTVGGSGSPAPFGTSGAATYRVRALAGTYDVSYVANASLCATAGAVPPLPCNGGRLKSGIALGADGVLDLDVPLVAVSGAVTVNGAAMPTTTADRGALTFVSRDGAASVSTPAFGRSGAVSYALALWPGTYDVALAADAQLCAAGAAAPAVPCAGGRVREGVALQSDGVLDVDLPAVSITGSVSLNGAALPTATADRGSVAFTRAAAEGTGAISISLGTNAPATYAVTLLAGHYVVSHAANAGSCGGTTPPSVPCASQELLGCN